MANKLHLDILKREGITAWNRWRQSNLDEWPNLSDANLSEVDLRGANLSDADLSRAELIRVNLSDADLSRAQLIRVNLRRAELSEADLRWAELRGANLSDANLSDADLSDADLRWAELRGANLSDANLSNADLSDADLRGANLGRANLSDADLRWADLRWAELIRVNLSEADLRWVDLRWAELIRVNLSEADLRWAELRGANLSEADLRWADLSEAKLSEVDLSEANLLGADLERADLSGANLSGANLTNAHLVETNFENAALKGCRIYGISAWGLKLQNAKQEDLIITRPYEPTITLDNLEVAQFIYMLLYNEKIRDIIDTITSKVVLILGRFTQERKAVLDAIRGELREHNYLPVLFDFEKPASRDITETISTLAHMARFVIADISDTRSIPQELEHIVPNLPSVPVQPLLQLSADEYGMFEHFKRYPWVLEIHRYKDLDDLLRSLEGKVIAPAEAKAKQLSQRG